MGSYLYQATSAHSLSKIQVQVITLKVKAHLEIAKQKKIEQISRDENTLIKLFKSPQRSKIQQVFQAQKVILDLKYIQACATIISYANCLRVHAQEISQNQSGSSLEEQLTIYTFSLIYAAPKLNLSSLNDFKLKMSQYFKNQNFQNINKVDAQLEEILKLKISQIQINQYLLQMSQRNNIPLKVINAAGHNIELANRQGFNYPLPTEEIKPFFQNLQKQQNVHQPILDKMVQNYNRTISQLKTRN